MTRNRNMFFLIIYIPLEKKTILNLRKNKTIYSPFFDGVRFVHLFSSVLICFACVLSPESGMPGRHFTARGSMW
jgi:hypothetical protein